MVISRKLLQEISHVQSITDWNTQKYSSELANSMPEKEKKDLPMKKVQEIRLAASSVLWMLGLLMVTRWTSMEAWSQVWCYQTVASFGQKKYMFLIAGGGLKSVVFGDASCCCLLVSLIGIGVLDWYMSISVL